MRGWKTKLCKLEEGFPVDELIQKKSVLYLIPGEKRGKKRSEFIFIIFTGIRRESKRMGLPGLPCTS